MPTLNKCRSRTDLMQLVHTAQRGDLTREPGQFWPVFCILGNPRPEIRSAVGQLIRDGFLLDPDPNATHSTIQATTKGLNKIGQSR